MNIKINKRKINVFEVGVGDFFTSKTKQYWGNKKFNVTLFEPNPFLYKSLLKKVQKYDNVELHNAAIYNEERLGKLVCAGVLSYLPEMISPIDRIFKDRLAELLKDFIVPVNLMTIDSFGEIDYLILGMEGTEFSVFHKLTCKPHLITLHNYFANDYQYTFPYFGFIQSWCKNNNYAIIMGIPDITLINLESVDKKIVKIKK